MNLKKQKVFIAGGSGFLGKRLIKRLQKEKINFVTTSLSSGTDFRNKEELDRFFETKKPDIVINCATFIGGIKFGLDHMAEIFYNNVLMNTYLIDSAYRHKVKQYINPISNCSYPDFVQKDFKEEDWWDGPLHSSVMVYGFVKKGTWVQNYAYNKQYGWNSINIIIPNMYGPGDYFDEIRSHAMGGLIKKIVKAKEENIPEVIVWGTGNPIREWLYVDDCVEIIMKSLELKNIIDPINIGQGKGISIKELAYLIKELVNYKGDIVFDTKRPDGAPYKIMNIEKMKKIYNWTPSTDLKEGVKKTLDWYYKNIIKK